MKSEWFGAACAHTAIVGLSLLLTFVIVTRIPLLQGEAIDAIVCGVLFFHLVALVVGLCMRRVTKTSRAVVFVIAFFPGAWTGVEMAREAWYDRYRLPYDRFRDYLADPVPESVENLRFVGLEESVTPNLMFRFDIDPEDLDEILKRLKLKRVAVEDLLNPKDYFRYPYYLPVEGKYELYQGKDEDGEVLTIKTNAAHTHAIFRKESSGFYRDREWEGGNTDLHELHNDRLKKLKRKYEDQQRD